MKYAIIICNNGNYSVDSEWGNLNSAKVSYHGKCQTLWNAPDVLEAHVMIADEQLDCVEGYKEYIHHDPQPQPEPAPEEV